MKLSHRDMATMKALLETDPETYGPKIQNRMISVLQILSREMLQKYEDEWIEPSDDEEDKS